jgi:ribosomal protein S18 acetylase RimI-like enzyme
MKLRVTVRDLGPMDLGDLDWSGGAEHLRAVSDALQAAYRGETAVVVATLGNQRLVGLGAVDFRDDPDAGRIWLLAVHETLQSLGIGRRLVGALERRIVAADRPTARLLVEHDNPRARALYARLGYADVGSALDGWPVNDGRIFVTVSTVMERALPGHTTRSH